MNFKVFRKASARDQRLFCDRIQWLGEYDRQVPSLAKNDVKAAILNEAVRRFEMWERFKERFFAVKKDMQVNCRDLKRQPPWPTEQHKNYLALKERWDNMSWEDEVRLFGDQDGLIDPLHKCVEEHEEWYGEDPQAEGGDQIERRRAGPRKICKGGGDVEAIH